MVEWKNIGEICYISDYVSNGSFASLRENVQYKNKSRSRCKLRETRLPHGMFDLKHHFFLFWSLLAEERSFDASIFA